MSIPLRLQLLWLPEPGNNMHQHTQHQLLVPQRRLHQLLRHLAAGSLLCGVMSTCFLVKPRVWESCCARAASMRRKAALASWHELCAPLNSRECSCFTVWTTSATAG